MMMSFKQTVYLFLCIALLAACNKDEELTFDPNAKLNFSTDSVLFDTVFTSIGSTTRRFKIFNYNKRAISLDEISIGGGPTSAFSVNVAGKQISAYKSLKINGNDSINVLVSVKVDPNLSNQPFIVEDSLLFQFNGKKEKIALIAFGQNAVFINGTTLLSNTVWDSKLPYIIYNNVTIAEDVTLNIAAGSRLLFHNGATMNVKGTLNAIGTKTDTILFASDRTERIYEEEPGQWNGIHFHGSSKNSIINNATIKNAIAGLTVDSISTTAAPKLTLANSIIKNMQVVGLLGYHTNIAAFNNLFYNCGQYLIYGIGGGDYDLAQNTFAAYNFNFARRTPAVHIADNFSSTATHKLNLTLYNNIIWGSLDTEFKIDLKGTQTNTIAIANNLVKSTIPISGLDNILNIDPLFNNARLGNFKVKENSPVIAKGKNLSTHPYYTTYLEKDMLEKARNFPATLGCYEF